MSLRWLLGLPASLFAVGWIVLIAGADSFRRSFGASENAWWKAAVPVVVALCFVASVVWPDRRLLLHFVAILAVALLIGCVFLARETIFAATVGAIYIAGWLLFYYRAVWLN